MEVVEQNVSLNNSWLSPIKPIPLILDWEEDLPTDLLQAGGDLGLIMFVAYVARLV